MGAGGRSRVDVSGAASLAVAACVACAGVSDASLPVDFGALQEDAEQPRAQAVLFLAVTDATLSSCPAKLLVELPDDTAPTTLAGTSGHGERLFDGVAVDGQVADIDCRVAPSEGQAGSFDVRLRLQQPRQGLSFEATGNLSESRSQLLAVASSALGHTLAQADCEAEVDAILPGAVWLRALRCPQLSSAYEPNQAAQCSAMGGLIFENCLP